MSNRYREKLRSHKRRSVSESDKEQLGFSEEDLIKTQYSTDFAEYLKFKLGIQQKNTSENIFGENDKEQELIMANIEGLTPEQIRAVLTTYGAARPQNENVLSICKNSIIHFKKDNIRNFLDSVKVAYAEVASADSKAKVIAYAKTRVDNDVIISQTEYATFDDFEKALIARFKPAEDTLQVNQQIMLMRQGEKESVKEYGEKALKLKEKFEAALFNEYASSNRVLDNQRVLEAEEALKRYFIIGLQPKVREYIRSDPKDFPTALSQAAMAEANCKLLTMTVEEDKKKEEKKPNQFRGGYRGNNSGQRGSFRGRGGNFQRGGYYYNNYRGGGQNGNGRGNGTEGTGQNSNGERGASNQGGGTVKKDDQNQTGFYGKCYVCGDPRHKAFECRKRAAGANHGAADYDDGNWRQGPSSPKNEDASALTVSASTLKSAWNSWN